MRAPTIFVGVNVILIEDGKVLLGKRLADNGAWGVPGGHLERGETLHECAKRELEEETGLIADELELTTVINQSNRPDGERHYIQFNFEVVKFHGEVKNCEPDICGGWEWFDLNDLPKDIFFAHKQFLPAFLNKQLLVDPEV